MSKKQPARAKTKGYVLGRRQFGKISAVEGIRLSASMTHDFAEFDRKGLSAAERRRRIIGRFKGRVG
jgi:hypothetical protein